VGALRQINPAGPGPFRVRQSLLGLSPAIERTWPPPSYSLSMADEESAPARGDALVPGGHLRATHDDRNHVVELLRVAAGDGQLTLDELTSEWALP
jgi:Domain of unknown function (DUF1707)